MNNSVLKKDFPILTREINGSKLVYLDNAATSQKPVAVIEAINNYYLKHNANIHRGLHTLSEEATEMYEAVRAKTAHFIYASHPSEIIFTKNATEGLNFAATVLTQQFVSQGDEILVTELEHHSNLVPWQIAAKKFGAKLEYVPVLEDGTLDLGNFASKVTDRTKIVAVAHASNVLGTILPLKKIAEIVHKHGALLVVDGAQAAPHLPVNVQTLDCDAYAFSAHKMLGPTGVGAVWMKKQILEKIEPYQFGGGMIEDVTATSSTWNGIPERFEAGTPNIEGVIAFGSALDYLSAVGMKEIVKHEVTLNKMALDSLSKIPGLTIYGPLDAEIRTGLVSFNLDKIHSHDVAAVLNSDGIAVRSGHHCAYPLHKKLNLGSTVRASYYLYNDEHDINLLVKGILKAQKILG